MSKPRSRVFTSHRITTKALIGVMFLVVGLICTLATFPRAAASDAKADNNVLKIYSDLSTLPIKERKALFRDASSNLKSDLWRTHFAGVLARQELNGVQKQVIRSAMSLATPEFFEVQANSPAWKTKVQVPVRALERQILAAFTFEDAVKIFATLGDNNEAANRTPTPSDSVSVKGINYRRRSNSGPDKDENDGLAVQDPPSGPPCSCSTNDDWCSISSYCGAASCSPTSSGCGTIWAYPCNGTCR